MVENAALRALRLLDLVPFIVRNSGISIRDLAKEFGVSRDEILKDLNLLFMCGLPGYTPLELIDLSFDDDTVVVRDPQNLDAPRNFTESEALALRVALSALVEVTPVGHRDHEKIQRLITKISSAFTSEIPEGAINFVADREKQVLTPIEQALANEQDLEIVYLNVSTDVSSSRHVSPIALEIFENRRMLRAFCQTAKGLRTFNLKYILSAKLVDRSSVDLVFDQQENPSIKAILNISSTGTEFVRGNDRVMKKIADSFDGNTYEIEVFQPEWIVRAVIREGGEAVLNEPTAIRRAIADRCSTALEQYGVIG